MGPNKCLIFCLISFVYNCVKAQYIDLVSNQLYSQPLRASSLKFNDVYLMQNKLQLLQGLQEQLQLQLLRQNKEILQQSQQEEKVKIQLFYECLCPDCRLFDSQQFAPTVKKLGNYLEVHLYPYGNARTIIHEDGKVEILCQHGPEECYGNMLHACAIDLLGNITQAVEFNSCMMGSDQKNRGSDNDAADKCGRTLNIDSEKIKDCAASPRGLMLLKTYGDESKKIGFDYVPYILINGQVNSGDKFLQDVCKTFKNPPPECNQ